ncbi:uncharacterized protein [Temnothorax nylanderi]|uniref:uncharacterized protein isoform X2 n=1 Tax=Temnothorax nylanderi TaxID=102681 RepID=UPI003A8BE5CF
MAKTDKPLRKHLMQRAKRAEKDLAKGASIERLRNRIFAPNSTSSDEEYMDVHISDRNSVSENPLRPCDNILEINENINIPETVVLENTENEREQGVHNENVIEALDLSDDEDDEIVLQNEVDHEDDASEDSDDYDEDVNENNFETEKQKDNYVAENLREWAIHEGSISKKKLDNLLHRLNPVFPTLPKSYKTLLRTLKHLDVCELPDGSMLWYKGIFVVVKFLQTEEDDNIYYEVALAKWLVQVDENMIGTILWPDSDALAGKLVRTEASADETWQQLEVEVKRYYGTYVTYIMVYK